MSKNLPENIDYASSADNTAASPDTDDLLHSFLNAPVSKLDADQYMVSDLDGITEGLFGSGNMNFLMMQSAQTNESIQNTNPMDAAVADGGPSSPLLGTIGAPSAFGTINHAGDLELFNPLASPDDMNISSDSGIGTGGPASAGGIGASSFAGGVQSQDALYSARNFGANGTDGNSGSSGTNGNNGTNGEDGTGTTIINNIDLTKINESVTNLFDTVNNITDNVFNTINNLFPGGDLGPIGLNLDLILTNLTEINLDFINGDAMLNVVNEVIDLSPVLDPVTTILGDIASGVHMGVLLDPFEYDNSPNDHDLVLTSGLELLGIPLPPLGFELPLDPVEFLIGDIDLNLGLTNDLLGLPILGGGGSSGDTDLDLLIIGDLLENNVVDLPLDIVFDPIEDLVGDLDIGLGGTLDLLGQSQTSNDLGDTDIILPLDINLAGSGLLNETLNIPLDPIEAITGDIDLDLMAAGDILGQTADSLIDSFAGGTGDDTILHEAGTIAGDLVNGLLPSNGETDVASDLTAGLLDNIPLIEDLDLSLDTVEHLLNSTLDITSVAGLDLLGTSTGGNDTTDLSLSPGLGLLDQTILDHNEDIPLDPFESLLGDIDLAENIDIDLVHSMPDASVLQDILTPIDTALNQAIDMIEHAPETLGIIGGIGDISEGGLHDLIGGTDLDGLLPSWTESTLPDAGDILGGGLLGDASSLLPDPIVAAASLLPAVPIVPVITGGLGSLGGGGGHHFGGLFG